MPTADAILDARARLRARGEAVDWLGGALAERERGKRGASAHARLG
jgi:hypothetical protein